MKLKLKHWLIDHDITQAELCDKFGWDKSKASKIVNGKCQYTARDVQQIIELTGGQITAQDMAEMASERGRGRPRKNG